MKQREEVDVVLMGPKGTVRVPYFFLLKKFTDKIPPKFTRYITNSSQLTEKELVKLVAWCELQTTRWIAGRGLIYAVDELVAESIDCGKLVALH